MPASGGEAPRGGRADTGGRTGDEDDPPVRARRPVSACRRAGGGRGTGGAVPGARRGVVGGSGAGGGHESVSPALSLRSSASRTPPARRTAPAQRPRRTAARSPSAPPGDARPTRAVPPAGGPGSGPPGPAYAAPQVHSCVPGMRPSGRTDRTASGPPGYEESGIRFRPGPPVTRWNDASAPGPSEPSDVFRALPASRAPRARARGRGDRAAGHEVRLLDLQIFNTDYLRELGPSRPQAVGFSVNYLANVPEVSTSPSRRGGASDCFVFVGGHSASFIAAEFLEHGDGRHRLRRARRGRGRRAALLEAIGDPKLYTSPAWSPPHGRGPGAAHARRPRSLLRPRAISRGAATSTSSACSTPAPPIEFTRGCPWDCSFCSAWTFYGRSYRKASPEAAAEDLARIREPNVFIVDDVAFIQPEHGFAIGREMERRRIRKQYYLETRCDVLMNQELFKYWKRLGLSTCSSASRRSTRGPQAPPQAGDPRARTSRRSRSPGRSGSRWPSTSSPTPTGTRRASRWCATGRSPCPRSSTSRWPPPTPAPSSGSPSRASSPPATTASSTSSTRCCPPAAARALLRGAGRTQAVLNRKHLGWGAVGATRHASAALLAARADELRADAVEVQHRLQPERQLADHAQPVRYELPLPTRLAAGDLSK